MLSRKKGSFNGTKKVIWRGAGGSGFLRRRSRRCNLGLPLFRVKDTWLLYFSSKVSFYPWEAIWAGVLTLDTIQRRVGSSRIDVFFVALKKDTPSHFVALLYSQTFVEDHLYSFGF